MAAIVFLSGVFLLYTAVIAPAQIFLWESDEVECKVFPTLYFDVCVDTFFLVSFILSCCFLKKKGFYSSIEHACVMLKLSAYCGS